MTEARFAVHDVGELTNRGRIVIGDILAGTVRVGMWASIERPNTNGRWLVAGVEFADNPSRHESHIGLVLADAPPLKFLREFLVRGSVLVVTDQGST